MRVQVIPNRHCKKCKQEGRGIRSTWWVDDSYDITQQKVPVPADQGGGMRKMTKEEYAEKLKKQERKIFGCVTCSGNVATNDDWGFGGIVRNWANKIQEATG